MDNVQDHMTARWPHKEQRVYVCMAVGCIHKQTMHAAQRDREGEPFCLKNSSHLIKNHFDSIFTNNRKYSSNPMNGCGERNRREGLLVLDGYIGTLSLSQQIMLQPL